MPDDLDPFDVAALGLVERLHPASMAVPAPRAVKTDEGDKANWICPTIWKANTPTPHPTAKSAASQNLVTIIGRLGNIPTYRVFQCDACKALQWVAEQITGDGDTA